jgi:hypothetical protein
MAVKTEAYSRTTRVNWNKAGAVAAQIISWLTTLWAVQWVWPEGAFVWQGAVAVALEALLVVMKVQLFNGGRPEVGWVGLGIDSVINTGGLLPRTGRVITFPPIAALLTFAGLNPNDPMTILVGGFLLALAGGILLSALPHRLWDD